MKRLLLATTAGLIAASAAQAQDSVNVGIILGFTGPLESITPDMATGAELAFTEINESGLLPGGATINPVRADSTCIDAAAATTAAEGLITSDNVVAIMGADCSGVTTAIANNVAVPNGVVMVSPSSTSPALSTIEDDGYFFRVAPSDARQGEIIADILSERGIDNVAITYTNNDYGKGLADAIAAAFEAKGGTVAINAAHEDGKGDYSAEVAALQASGAEHLIVAGYVDQGGVGIVQASLDTGAFDSFFFPDGMIGQSLIDSVGDEINGKVIGTQTGSEGEGASRFAEIATRGRPRSTGHLRGRELRCGGADRAGHGGRRRTRPHRHPRQDDRGRQRAGRADLPRRARQGSGAGCSRHGHRLSGCDGSRTDRSGRSRGLVPRVRDLGQHHVHDRLPLSARDRPVPSGAGRQEEAPVR